MNNGNNDDRGFGYGGDPSGFGSGFASGDPTGYGSGFASDDPSGADGFDSGYGNDTNYGDGSSYNGDTGYGEGYSSGGSFGGEDNQGYGSQDGNGSFGGVGGMNYNQNEPDYQPQQDNYDPNAPLYNPQNDYDPNISLYNPSGDNYSSNSSGSQVDFVDRSLSSSKYNMNMTISKGKYTWIIIIALVLGFLAIGGFILYKALFEKKSIKDYWESKTGQGEIEVLKKEFLAENPDALDFNIVTEGDDTLVYVVTYDKVNFTTKEKPAIDAYFQMIDTSMKQEIQKIMSKSNIREFSIVFRFLGKTGNVMAEYTYKLN